MCGFFSLVSDPEAGKIMYFDWTLREKCLKGELDYEPDSHTSIADYFGYKGIDEDKLNKYEFNPLTKVLTIDRVNHPINDSEKVEKFCRSQIMDIKKSKFYLVNIDKGLIYPQSFKTGKESDRLVFEGERRPGSMEVQMHRKKEWEGYYPVRGHIVETFVRRGTLKFLEQG